MGQRAEVHRRQRGVGVWGRADRVVSLAVLKEPFTAPAFDVKNAINETHTTCVRVRVRARLVQCCPVRGDC